MQIAIIQFAATQTIPDSVRVDSISFMKPQSVKKDSTAKSNNSNKIDAQIKYSAEDSMRFNMKEKKVYLYGKAKILYKDLELNAEYIELDLSNDKLFANGIFDSLGRETGKPEFQQGSDKFTCNDMTYNYKTQRGIIKGVITEQSGGFLHSDITKRQANEEICIKKGKYTTCDLEHPHFYIGLTKAKVIPDKKIVSGPAYLVIEDVVLPVGIPFGYFPNKSGHSSGVIIPEYGEETNRGFYLRNGGYYFALSDYYDLTLQGDIYSKGSWGAYIASNYKKRYKFDGNVNFKYEAVKVGDPESPDFTKKNIYWLRWTHKQDQKARPYSNFSANVDFGKTTFQKYSSYTDPNSYLRNTTQSSISYSKRFAGTPINMSANIRHSQNSINKTVSLSAPELAINMNRIYPLKRKKVIGEPKLWEKFGVSANINTKNTITSTDSTLYQDIINKRFVNGLKLAVPMSLSTKILKYFTITPAANYNGYLYANSIEKLWDDTLNNNQGGILIDTINGFRYAHDFNVSATLNTKLYGMYAFKKGRINAIRHVMSPSVSLNYRPDFGKEKWNYYRYYQTNAAGDSALYSIFEKGIYNGPPSGKYGMVSFSLGNNLEMKVRNPKDTTGEFKKVVILESLNLNSSYNIAADSLNWSPVVLSGRTTLFKSMNLTFNGTFDPYAIDELGHTIDKPEIDRTGKLCRLTNASISLGYRINPKTKKKKDDSKTSQLIGYPDDYIDFNIPWNLTIDYTIRYTASGLNKDTTQSLRFSGDINLTPKWKISVSSGYDFSNKEFTYTSINIYRDLHCWEMRFTWIPFGFRRSYNFQINVKSSVLQDLKLAKRSNWSDNFN